MFELMPGQHLGFSFSQEEGTYLFAHDATKLDSTRLNTPEKVDDWLGACYYIHTAFCPDMDSIRKGIICLAECDGWDWTKKQDFKIFQKFFSELLTVYPFNGQVRHYHTGTTLNIMAAMLRQILPAHLRNTFKTGLVFEGRLDKFFLVPDAKTANQRMLARMKATLKRRYDHEKSFSLKGNC
ncbi:expressed unknown protein [Seminavis robusta]|uniref:Uncharacterized protein n=1 Tax=Seminavis robusta TaxID=568900 RepID=A0A9N8DDL2_9STRA|nr:expressed unknown protein [Seminavis robusta]|eukprot:Sro98_g050570.1 n/a (182) ;mRNA; f:87378-88020